MTTRFRLLAFGALVALTVGCSPTTTELQLEITGEKLVRPKVKVSCIRSEETKGYEIETIESTENTVVWEITPDSTKPVRFGVIRSENGWEFSKELLQLPEDCRVIRTSELAMDFELDTR